MKNFIIGLLVIITFPLQGQLILDKWGEIIPFSQSEKYKIIIDVANIHSLVLPFFNNDSLFSKNNGGKSREQSGYSFVSGLEFDTLISLREKAKRFNIDEGSLWIYTIESSASESLFPKVKPFNIPKGAYLSFITVDNKNDEPVTYTKESIQSSAHFKSDVFFGTIIEGKRAIIEYFEPKEVTSNFDIWLNAVIYYFAGRFNNKSNLKSGVHGTAINSLCQEDINCLSNTAWKNEANSIGYIEVNWQAAGYQGTSIGTAFFINKVGDYEDDDEPYFISAGHLFLGKVNGVYYDVSNSWDYATVWVDYLNPECNSSEKVSGAKIGGGRSNINWAILPWPFIPKLQL